MFSTVDLKTSLISVESFNLTLLHGLNLVGVPSVIITAQYEGVSASQLIKVCCIVCWSPRSFLFIILLVITLNVPSTLLLWGSWEQYAE